MPLRASLEGQDMLYRLSSPPAMNSLHRMALCPRPFSAPDAHAVPA